MSSLITLPQNGLTERHDSFLGMIYEWLMEDPSIPKTIIAQGLAQPEELKALAVVVRATGRGDKEGLPEMGAAHMLLAFFLVNRTVRRKVAAYNARSRNMRKGEAMKALGELKSELEVLTRKPLGN